LVLCNPAAQNCSVDYNQAENSPVKAVISCLCCGDSLRGAKNRAGQNPQTLTHTSAQAQTQTEG